MYSEITRSTGTDFQVEAHAHSWIKLNPHYIFNSTCYSNVHFQIKDFSVLLFQPFTCLVLADRTNGHAIVTVFRLFVYVQNVLWLNGAS